MPIEVWERPNSRSGGGSSSELIFMASGSEDAGAIATAVAAFITSEGLDTYEGFTVHDYNADWIGPSLWEASVTYGPQDKPKPNDQPTAGDTSISFDTTGGTRTMLQSLETINIYRAPGATEDDAPDFKGMMCVNEDKEAEGTEVLAPTLKLSKSKWVARASVTEAFIAALAAMTPSTNDATAGAFAEGELLFIGAKGTIDGNVDLVKIDYDFLANANRTGITSGPVTGIAVKGFEFAWPYYKLEDDPEGTPNTIKVLKGVYVERVYYAESFATLGLF